jgi:transcriptional regulator of PTS gene
MTAAICRNCLQTVKKRMLENKQQLSQHFSYKTRKGEGGRILSLFYGTTLRLVQDIGPISRVEMMREMDISSASLTKITTSLIDARRLEESDLRNEGSFGRPRCYLQLAPDRHRALCATLMPGQLKMRLTGPDGEA